jgi:hypothetical protein
VPKVFVSRITVPYPGFCRAYGKVLFMTLSMSAGENYVYLKQGARTALRYAKWSAARR